MSDILLTREQLEERLATLHRASLELVKETSLESLLKQIATLACEQVDAQYTAVGVLDPNGSLVNFIPVGMTDEEIRQMPHPPLGLGLIGALMNTAEPIRIPLIANHARSVGFPAGHPAMTSFLGVPIRMADQQLGQIYLTNKTSGPEFTLEDQRVIEMLAAYAAVAISNVRALAQLNERDRMLTRRNENLALLNELAVSLTSTDNIEQVLEKVMGQVIDYLRLDVGEVFLRQEDSSVLQMVLHQGDGVPQVWDRKQFQFGQGAVGQTAESGIAIDINVAAERLDPNINQFPYLNPAALNSRLNQMVCLPLTGGRGILGVLCVGTCQTEPLDELEMQFLAAISAWVGTAIENMRLNVHQRRLAVLEERERIGMDLHDGIIQDIYAVGLTLEHARLLLNDNPQGTRQRIEQAVNDLNSTIRDIRSYILDLRPRKLYEENLVDGIRRLMAEFRANTLIEVSFQGPPQNSIDLPKPQAVALFHICQEALANVGKHASARRVGVSLWSTGERVLLEISDDGHGFNPEKMRLTLGHGLSNMQTRARNAGGDLEITSDPDSGTTILAWVPNVPHAA